MRDIDGEFATAIRDGRARKRWSQQRLADEMRTAGLPRVYQTTVARMESGERKVSLGEALRVAALLDIPIAGVKHDDENATLRRRHERIKAIIDGQED